jgi:hypothetical protein
VKRLARILPNALTALSLLVFIAIAALWMRSYWRVDEIIWAGQTTTLAGSSGPDPSLAQSNGNLGSCGGIVFLVHHSRRFPEMSWAEKTGWRRRAVTVTAEIARENARLLLELNMAADSRWRIWLPGGWFEHEVYVYPETQGRAQVTTRRLIIPCWLVAAAALPLPALRGTRTFGRARRRRHMRIGACPECGYDLRATPDRCPECGMVPRGR